MESNPLPGLLNTGYTIIEFGLFYGGENLEAKIWRFQTFSDNMAVLYALVIASPRGDTPCGDFANV